MGSRWFNISVVLIWLTTGTWLLVAKIVPPMRRGDPPNYHTMYSAQATDEATHVAWDMTLNGKSLGYAVISLQKKNSDMTEVESRIHFEHVPLEELSPAWMKTLVHSSMPPGDNLRMYVESHLIIDKLGYLSEFNSLLRIDGLRDVIRIKGIVNGTLLKIVVRSGELEYPFDTYLPGDALVSDELSPQLCLTGLRIGQEWTVPVFSPLRPPNNPVDVLQARVERRDIMMWEGQGVPVDLVEYRADSGSALSSTSEARARLWVRDDGAVLKQEISVLGSELAFVRVSPERSEQLAAQSKEEEPERRRWGYNGFNGFHFGRSYVPNAGANSNSAAPNPNVVDPFPSNSDSVDESANSADQSSKPVPEVPVPEAPVLRVAPGTNR